MSEHTPGPWVRGEDNYVMGPNQRYIADILPTERNSSGQYSLSLEDRANGRLILAAPDLLEACKEARDAIGLFEDAWFCPDEFRKVFAACIAAIAKAEGMAE